MNRKESVILAIGLLILNSDFILNRYIVIDDFYTGLLKGVGLALLISVLITYWKRTKTVC